MILMDWSLISAIFWTLVNELSRSPSNFPPLAYSCIPESAQECLLEISTNERNQLMENCGIKPRVNLTSVRNGSIGITDGELINFDQAPWAAAIISLVLILFQ
jgi:hypothetical protein